MTARSQKPDDTRPARLFHRPVDVRRLPDGGQGCDIEAEPAECAALAAAMGIPGIGSLRASFALRPRAGGRVTVAGEVKARVTQLCVVTVEPFDCDVEQEVDLVFAPAAPEPPSERRRRGDVADFASPRTVPGSDDQVDPPDPIVDDVIDLGAVAAEFVALALDPYPRKPGASFSDVVEPRDDEPSAFAALERLKAKP